MQEVKFILPSKAFKGKKIKVAARLTTYGDKLYIESGYCPELIEEIKMMDGSRYHGYDKDNPRKVWSVYDNDRNHFQILHLLGANPYARYDTDLIEYKSNSGRPLYKHQIDGVSHFITRRQCILAGEPGVGKTLMTIEMIEWALNNIGNVAKNTWFVGTKSSIYSVRREFVKWDSKVIPEFMTYEAMKKRVYSNDYDVPFIIVYDECQKIRSVTAQRSVAAKRLADHLRLKYREQAFVILMSGTPAPKDPTNWYMLTEIACPGFLKEGNITKFRKTLALIKKDEGFGGGVYNKLITWWDNESKCKHCGEYEDHYYHDFEEAMFQELASDSSNNVIGYHHFEKSVNEVERLYRRLKGITTVILKKDCLQLPEKIYEIRYLEPSRETLNALELIKRTSKSAIEILIRSRELSDGFQYVQEEVDREIKCKVCLGKGTLVEHIFVDKNEEGEEYEIFLTEQKDGHWYAPIYNEEGVQIDNRLILKDEIKEKEIKCYRCNGKGKIKAKERQTVEINCPKEDALLEYLDEYEEQGRMVIFAGFKGSIDRCVKVCRSAGWDVIRVDGGGWWSNLVGDPIRLQDIFDDKINFKRVAFIGQPEAGGVGLNLTASSVALYYSNTFKYEDRDQSENRIHRIGADPNRGCRYIDLVHLPTDMLIIKNHKKKKDLQSMTLGDFNAELLNTPVREE